MKKDNRKNVIYARVSTNKQKKDLGNQVESLQKYCKDNDIHVDAVYSEIASGIDLDRTEISNLLNEVLHDKIKNIYITHKDRLTRLSFITLETIFKKFGTNIIVTEENPTNEKDQEIFSELISLIHIFSTKMYSNRRKQKLLLTNKDLSLFDEPNN